MDPRSATKLVRPARFVPVAPWSTQLILASALLRTFRLTYAPTVGSPDQRTYTVAAQSAYSRDVHDQSSLYFRIHNQRACTRVLRHPMIRTPAVLITSDMILQMLYTVHRPTPVI